MVVNIASNVGKRTSEVVAVYLSPEQKKQLEQWAAKERRSVSNLAANILADALEEKFSDRTQDKKS
ncbi:hypothetical protein TUMEXPCC7403_25230 [Tumidithrix helvetica PCC 7403]|uniref:ribbon-helix-helix domain-containing protein n=1 Tax=Tumidithrix helvetica TaxID=3457545 RepID=UPI003C89DE11